MKGTNLNYIFRTSYIDKFYIKLSLQTDKKCDHDCQFTSVIIKPIPEIFLV